MTVREYTADDTDHVHRLRRLAFGGPRDPEHDRRLTGRRGLIAELDGQPAGVLHVGEFRQFFGGRAIPMGGVAGVAVHPGARGRGVATELLDEALRGMRAAGQPLSVLYATVPGLYRSRGWEYAGRLEWLDVAVDRLTALPRGDRALTTRVMTAADLPGVRALYRDLAGTVDGMLDRDTPMFRPDEPLDADVATVLVDAAGALAGYLAAERPDRPGDTAHLLRVLDLVGRDGDAVRALLRQVGSWSGLIERVTVRVTDPAVTGLFTAQPMSHPVRTLTWLLRVVDLPAAVAARGWPAAAWLRPSTVDVEVVDEHAPWHAGRHRLVVEDGKVRVELGGDGDVRLHARALGPWFAGAQNTAALRRAGLLTGDPAAAALLDVLTAAPGTPRMADFF